MGSLCVTAYQKSFPPCFTMSSRPSSMPARPVGERSQISAEDLKNHTPLKRAETKENTKLPDSDGKLRKFTMTGTCVFDKGKNYPLHFGPSIRQVDLKSTNLYASLWFGL